MGRAEVAKMEEGDGGKLAVGCGRHKCVRSQEALLDLCCIGWRVCCKEVFCLVKGVVLTESGPRRVERRGW